MNQLRILVLVLLAFLLPIRGAVAATMLCPHGEVPGDVAVLAGHQDHDLQADHPMHADHSPAHHHVDEDPPGADAPSADHPATCPFCASTCCMACIVGTVPSVGAPGLIASARFPALTARIPAFLSDGQERPPRTI